MPDNEIIFCIVNGAGGPVQVTLTANNGLLAGGQFALFDAHDAPRGDAFKLGIGTDGTGTTTLNSTAVDLDQNVLSWEVDVCSLIPGADRGAVEISLVQDGVACPLTKDLHWDLGQLPQCSSGNVVAIRRGIIFRAR